MIGYLAAAAALLSAPTAGVVDAPCVLAQHVIVWCGDNASDAPRNAADLFLRYHFDRTKLDADFTRPYLARFGCGVYHDDGQVPLTFTVMRRGQVAGEDGWRLVDRVIVQAPERVAIVWAADQYLSKACPTAGEYGKGASGK